MNSPLTCIETEVLLTPKQSPPGGLLIECSSKLLPRWPHFRGPACLLHKKMGKIKVIGRYYVIGSGLLLRYWLLLLLLLLLLFFFMFHFKFLTS